MQHVRFQWFLTISYLIVIRLQVRFATKVKRDGKIVRKKKWFGGRVSAVSKEGSKIRIKYDDGTAEISKFPDKDVVVDDAFNGEHQANAVKFQPPEPEPEDPTEHAEDDDIDDHHMDDEEKRPQPNKQGAATATEQETSPVNVFNKRNPADAEKADGEKPAKSPRSSPAMSSRASRIKKKSS